MQRLIVEFAVEDVRILRAREAKKKQVKMRAGELQNSRENEEEKEGRESPRMRRKERDGGERGNKRVEWQVKCKEKRLRKRERQSEKTVTDVEEEMEARAKRQRRSIKSSPSTADTPIKKQSRKVWSQCLHFISELSSPLMSGKKRWSRAERREGFWRHGGQL